MGFYDGLAYEEPHTTLFTYRLVNTRTGEIDRWETIPARNRTDARKQIAAAYRYSTPSWRNGFYPFAAHRIEWMDGALTTPRSR